MKTKLQKFKSILSIAVATSALLFCQQAKAISFDINSTGNAVLRFTGTGNTMAFIDSTTTNAGFDFTIGNTYSGTGVANGLRGNIGGTYTIGAITNVAGVETAPVSGSTVGGFSINDGAGFTLTGDISWVTIKTDGNAASVNSVGSINLTSLAYGGANVDLIALKTQGAASGIAALSFNFIPAQTLTGLTLDGTVTDTGYNGQVASVPEAGSCLALMGLALLGLEGFRRKFKTK